MPEESQPAPQPSPAPNIPVAQAAQKAAHLRDQGLSHLDQAAQKVADSMEYDIDLHNIGNIWDIPRGLFELLALNPAKRAYQVVAPLIGSTLIQARMALGWIFSPIKSISSPVKKIAAPLAAGITGPISAMGNAIKGAVGELEEGVRFTKEVTDLSFITRPVAWVSEKVGNLLQPARSGVEAVAGATHSAYRTAMAAYG